MSQNVLFLAHVDESGTTLPKAAYEALGAAIELTAQLGGKLTVGLLGENIQVAADTLAGSGAAILGVSGSDFAYPRYASDAAAVTAICTASSPQIVIASGTSRFMRVIPGVVQRLKGQVDTHLTSIELVGGIVTAKRWFYRQRLEAVIQREARPWFLVLDPGCHRAWSGPQGKAEVQAIDVQLTDTARRTTFTGVRTPSSTAQTIRPDAKLLFVAGAGWCKKQSDGTTHLPEAETAILEFLQNSGASLGGSKSLVDQSGENQAVLGFMTHLNQVGQTGSTPRHPKGLSTCCHGEEPHVVGWRFINQRRAVNLDPNCGWARGKADVLYVADAFQVMAKLNALLAAQADHKEELATTTV
jgi:electron transfer flavoprotein alpha subunit